MQVKALECKSILNKTSLAGVDYTINPYFGCTHGCVYCYCRELSQRFQKHSESWGTYIDVKVNAPEVLRKQLAKDPRGSVWLSSATDPYQPIEEKYKLTRGILEELLNSRLEVGILSKGGLATRDIDLFKKFGDRIAVGFTINTLDDSVRRRLEPGATPIEERVEQLHTLREAGVSVNGSSFGPVFPEFTDAEEIMKVFKDAGATYVFTESFNTRGENWTEVKNMLEKHYPELVPKYEEIYFNPQKNKEWHLAMKKKIDSLAEKYNIKCDVYFNFKEKFSSSSR